jgi:FkbM family methyltransferase
MYKKEHLCDMSQDYRNCLLKSLSYLSSNPLFFDIGCNINPISEYDNQVWVENWNDDFTFLVFEYLSNSRCVGVEPLHWQTYEQRWLNDKRVQLLKIALSDKNCYETLYYPGNRHVLTSFYLQENFNDHQEEINYIQLQCKTLDSICEDMDLPFIDYLKIDTEGAEFKIIKGAEKLIQNKKINFIQFEYDLPDESIPNVSQICNFLKFYGYEEILTSNREKLWSRL